MVFYLHFRGLLLILKSHSIFLSPFYMLIRYLCLFIVIYVSLVVQFLKSFAKCLLSWPTVNRYFRIFDSLLIRFPVYRSSLSSFSCNSIFWVGFQPCIEWILIEIIFFSVNNLPTGYIILLLFISFWAFPFFPAYWRYSASIPQKLRSVRYYFTLVRTTRTRNIL